MVAARPIDLLRPSVFGNLPPGRLEAVAVALAPVHVRSGERVVEQGDVADRFYFIDRGSFRMTQRAGAGEEVELRMLGPGDVFGEIGLLTAASRTATVTAASDGALLALDRDGFLDLVSSGPGLSSRLLDLHRGATASVRP